MGVFLQKQEGGDQLTKQIATFLLVQHLRI
jgi:hypothetical protein